MTRTLALPSLPQRNDLLVVLAAVLGVNTVGALPALFIGADTTWLAKPWFFPPEVAFPVVWTLLFTLLGVALARVWRAGTGAARRRALVAFAGQFALNLLWPPVVFRAASTTPRARRHRRAVVRHSRDRGDLRPRRSLGRDTGAPVSRVGLVRGRAQRRYRGLNVNVPLQRVVARVVDPEV